MEKQIIYPKFIDRLFASAIDFTVIYLAAGTFIIPPINKLLIKINFGYQETIDSIQEKVRSALIDANVGNFDSSYVIAYIAEMIVLQIFIMFCYFVLLWSIFGTSFGKYFMRLKIVNYPSLRGKPGLISMIKRCIIYPLGFLSIFSMIFSKEKRALHDKFAGTIVVKK